MNGVVFCGGGAVAGLSGTICGMFLSTENEKAAPEQAVFGWAEKFRAALESRNGVSGPQRYGKTFTVTHDPLVWREVADGFLREAGVQILYHSHGLIPTFSHHCGGLRAFGRRADEAMEIWATLKRMEDVGVFAVEAECIAEEVLEAVNDKTTVVTFSLGSGMAGDAIFSFLADVCGETSEEDKPPKHAHAFGQVGRLHKQIHDERVAALGEFHREVAAGNFPYPQTNISMHAGEKDKFLEALDNWTPTHQ